MGFWNLSDGNQAEAKSTFEMGGGSEPIPDNTNVMACIDEAGWKTWEDDEYIELRWTVLDGQYKNRKVFQKVRVKDADAKKRDKAIRMLAAIDTNCGGKLMEMEDEPGDHALMQFLSNKPMVIKVMVWEMGDRKGNWVAMVSAANGKAPEAPTAKAQEKGGDIPF